MAYVIGSQKGKDIAESLKTGQKYAASDGSTWTKQADGSVSVTTSSGQTFNNAYTPSSSGSTSGGSAKGNYSQYTSNPYQIGSQRGQTIAQDMGIGQSWTNDVDGSVWYKNNDGTITVTDRNGYVTPNAYQMTDLGTLGKQQMSAGLSSDIVEGTMWERYYKAKNDPNLQQYVSDDVFNQMYQYVQDARAKENKEFSQQELSAWLEEYLSQNQQPTAPQSDPRIDQILNEILNRDSFSYDAMNDPLYQQYAEMYQREGDRAMRNTMAEAAASAGGMNTYAMTAAMQANNYYNSQLNDKIPQLYQLAYDKYLKDIDLKVQDLGILQDMDATQYNRYRDTMSDWRDDKDFAYGMYYDAVQQGNWQTQQDYNSMWDMINFNNNNYLAEREWKENIADKEYNRNQYNSELEYNRNEENKATAEERVNNLIKYGEMPSDDLISQAGMDKSYVLQLVNAVRRELGLYPIGSASSAVTYNSGLSGSSSGGSSKSGGSSGSSSSSGGSGSSGTATTKTTNDNSWQTGLTQLGLGSVYSPSLLVDLNKAGAITESNGKLKWTNGWSASNYEDKLDVTKRWKPSLFL